MEAGVLAEAAAMPWRRRASERTLAKEGRIWTLWSVAIVLTFGLPAALLIWIQPLTFPVAAIFLGHGIAVLHLQARRGARGVKPIGGAASPEDRRALGLLGDLVGHEERELLPAPAWRWSGGGWGPGWSARRERSWCAGGHRVHCFCVRVGEAGDLPPADRVAHLLLALREDEEGFATVANRNFSGATWRVRLQLRPPRGRHWPRGRLPALRATPPSPSPR